MILRHTLLVLLILTLGSAETFESMQAKTDMTNADSVYQLAKWCAQNNMPTKSNQLYAIITKSLDKEHEGAREALGQVRVGDRWVAKALAPRGAGAQPGGSNGDNVGSRPTGGVGPKAKDVPWNLVLPKDPGPANNPFIDSYIAKLPKIRNDSDEMGAAIATILRDDNWSAGMPRLCAALIAPGFDDIYGACEITMELRKQGRESDIKVLYPFIVRGSEKVTDAEDLTQLCMIAASIRDRNTVPRLIELLGTSVKDDAVEAISRITFLPSKDISVGRVQSWWDANWSRPISDVMLDQLRGGDPEVQVEAAAGLCELRNKAIFPVLFKLLRNEDLKVRKRAIAVIRQATTQDWSYEPVAAVDIREKRIELMLKWWKEAEFTFAWPGLPKPPEEGGRGPQAAVDPNVEQVGLLASTTGNLAQEAESRLRGNGNQAIPALIHGLNDSSALVRLRSHVILKDVTKQDFSYDSRAEESLRQKAVDAWRAWAIKQKHMLDDPPPGEDKNEGQ